MRQVVLSLQLDLKCEQLKACKELEKRGAKFIRQPGPMKNDPLEIAFLADPYDYKVELIGMKSFREATAY